MLQNCSIMKVAEIFFNEPEKDHYLIEISKKAGLAHTSVKNYLNLLIKENIIIETFEKKGKRRFPIYKSNTNNQDYRNNKITNNLHKLLSSNLIDSIINTTMPECIILFGSYRKGEDTEESDIDLYIKSNKKNIDLSRFEKLLNRKIQTHFKIKFNEYPKELKNNIINGIVLYGHLEAFI